MSNETLKQIKVKLAELNRLVLSLDQPGITTYKEAKERVDGGELFEDIPTLSLVAPVVYPKVPPGPTIAHYQVSRRGWTTNNFPVLALIDEGSGLTVAHAQVLATGWRTENLNILALADAHGWTVAHYQVGEGWTTEDPDILRLRNNFGWTVAHQQALNGWRTANPAEMGIADIDGTTVGQVIKVVAKTLKKRKGKK